MPQKHWTTELHPQPECPAVSVTTLLGIIRGQNRREPVRNLNCNNEPSMGVLLEETWWWPSGVIYINFPRYSSEPICCGPCAETRAGLTHPTLFLPAANVNPAFSRSQNAEKGDACAPNTHATLLFILFHPRDRVTA